MPYSAFMQERVGKNAEALQNIDVKIDSVGLMGTHEVSTENKNKLNQTKCCIEEVACSSKLETVKIAPLQPGEVINLDCDTGDDRYLLNFL